MCRASALRNAFDQSAPMHGDSLNKSAEPVGAQMRAGFPACEAPKTGVLPMLIPCASCTADSRKALGQSLFSGYRDSLRNEGKCLVKQGIPVCVLSIASTCIRLINEIENFLHFPVKKVLEPCSCPDQGTVDTCFANLFSHPRKRRNASGAFLKR